MRFGYTFTVLLYAMSLASFSTAGCGPAYAGKVNPGQVLATISAGVDIIDSCTMGSTKECNEQTADPVKDCLYEQAKGCVDAVTTGTEALLGALGWVPSFRQGGPFGPLGSGAGEPALAADSCVAALDSEAAALACARGVPARPGSECIAEAVADCMRLSRSTPLRVALAETPPWEAPPTPPPVTTRPAPGAQ